MINKCPCNLPSITATLALASVAFILGLALHSTLFARETELKGHFVKFIITSWMSGNMWRWSWGLRNSNTVSYLQIHFPVLINGRKRLLSVLCQKQVKYRLASIKTTTTTTVCETTDSDDSEKQPRERWVVTWQLVKGQLKNNPRRQVRDRGCDLQQNTFPVGILPINNYGVYLR